MLTQIKSKCLEWKLNYNVFWTQEKEKSEWRKKQKKKNERI